MSVKTQRLEELAIKQSRQLIPVTPSMPKALVRELPAKYCFTVCMLQILVRFRFYHLLGNLVSQFDGALVLGQLLSLSLSFLVPGVIIVANE